MIEIYTGWDDTSDFVHRLAGETEHQVGVAWIATHFGRVHLSAQTPLGPIGLFDAEEPTTAFRVQTTDGDQFLLVVTRPQ